MRKPSEDELRDALTVGHFGTDNGPLPASDPLTPTAMVVAIAQIDFYERNPRRAPNHQYEPLKESIRLRGLQQPMVITRRPGAPHYIPKHGGNTRLAILKELFAETGDATFSTASCEFHPWTTEADVLIGHLLENELRGDLVFIDKARAIRDAKELLEQETGTELSMRQLTERLRARGYRVSPPIISYCDYAVDVLAAAIPRALNAGLGKPAIQRLRELDRAAVAVWEHRDLGPDDLYRSIFAEAIAAADNDLWDFDAARRSLAQVLAQRAGSESRHILLEIGAELADNPPDDDEDELSPRDPAEDPPDIERWSAAPADPRSVFDTSERPPTDPHVRRATEPSHTSPKQKPAAPDRTPAAGPAAVKARTAPSGAGPPEQSQDHAEHTPAQARLPGTPAPPASRQNRAAVEIERLRQALRDRARDYAAHSELGYCLRFEGSPWIKLGYIVSDFPAQAQMAALSKDFAAREALVWKWYELTRCCDLLPIAGHIENLYEHDPAAKAGIFAELFGPGTRYLKAWTSPDVFLEALAEAVGIMDLQQFSFYAERVDDDTWQAGMRMLQAYRDLKVYAASLRLDLIQDDLAADIPSLPAAEELDEDLS